MFWLLEYLTHNNLSPLNVLEFIIKQIMATLFISGNLAASNFNVAHELFHKDSVIDKALGTFTMARNLHMHFAIEHIFGHHRHVATPLDATSARKG